MTTLFSFYRKRGIYILVFVSSFVITINSNAQNFQFNDSTARIRLTGSPSDIVKQIHFSDLHFLKETKSYINFGIVGDTFKYFVVKLYSTFNVAKEYVLSIDNTSLDSISIYRIYPNQTGNLLYAGGCLVPYDKSKAYVWHTTPVEITATPSYYLVALKAHQKNINVQYDILSEDALQRKYRAHDRFVFLYIGIFCLILVVISVAYFLFRKRVFIIYLGYIICISAWIISHYGYLFPWVYPDIPILNEIVKPVSSLGAGYFLVVLLNNVFRQNLRTRLWLQQMLTAMKYILPILCMLMLLLLVHGLPSSMKGLLITLWHIGLLFSVCLIFYTPLCFVYASPVAKIFSLAMLVITITSVVHLFGNSGYINNYFFNEHGITTASIVENFIITFGLFYRLLEENNEKKQRVLVLEQEQSDTLKKLITVQDSERKRIANDLHDNIGPLLAAIKINFRRLIDNKDALQNGLMHKTELIIDDSILEIRNVAHNLMPKSLNSKGLIEVLREYFEEIEQLYNKKITFNHQVQSILQDEVQLNIYRIICELVLNAVKHSEANELIICISSNEHCITVSIKDDGKGFNVKSADFKKSFGLQSAESRIQFMKGKFALKTSPGHGTMIDMEIPL